MKLREIMLVIALVTAPFAVPFANATERLAMSETPQVAADKLARSITRVLHWALTSSDDSAGVYTFETDKGKLVGTARVGARIGGSTVTLSFVDKKSGEAPSAKAERRAAERIFRALRSLEAVTGYERYAASSAPIETEVVVAAALQPIKLRVVDDMTKAGLGLVSETEHQLAFVQDRAVQRGFWDYVLYGNYLPAGQRIGLTFLFLPEGAGTRVRAQGVAYTWNGYGWVTAQNLMDTGARGEIAGYLQRIKADFELPVFPPK